MRQRQKKILSACLVLSFIAHMSALVFVQRHSLWFRPQSPKTEAPWLSLIDKKERDQILKEAFAPSPTGEGIAAAPSPKEEKKSALPLRSPRIHPEETDLLSYALFQPQLPFPAENLLALSSLPSFSFPAQDKLNLFDHLPKDLIIPAPAPSKQLSSPAPKPVDLLPTPPLEAPRPAVKEEVPLQAPIAYAEPLLRSPSEERPQPSRAVLPTRVPELPRIPTLSDLDTTSCSDSFDADLVFLPREEGEGYIFALTLIPRPDLDLPKLQQNFTFFIDRSNTIQADRLAATKSAIYKALEEMSPDDHFNIVAFDSKLEKLSPSPLPFSVESLARAEAFLEKISLGSFFSQANLSRPLMLSVPGNGRDEEIHTAILFTDSESLAKKNDQKALLFDWTLYNSGKVALFTVGLKGDRHLGTLDAASAFNRGKIIESPTKRGLKRKILKLMKTIQNPIGKNLVCHAISLSPKAKIEIFPKPMQMPHLYLEQPYVILGSAETLDDFILFVQGRIKGKWLNIKKTVSFLNAKKGNQSLKGEWALQRAYGLYELYLRDDNPGHLAEARSLLEPYNTQIAFE